MADTDGIGVGGCHYQAGVTCSAGSRDCKKCGFNPDSETRKRRIEKAMRDYVDTAIETCVIIFNKRKTDTNITFEDRETGAEAVATLDDVRKQGFTLSTSAYIQTEDERESVDIAALNAEIDAIVARENVLRDEIKDIIAEIEGH